MMAYYIIATYFGCGIHATTKIISKQKLRMNLIQKASQKWTKLRANSISQTPFTTLERSRTRKILSNVNPSIGLAAGDLRLNHNPVEASAAGVLHRKGTAPGKEGLVPIRDRAARLAFGVIYGNPLVTQRNDGHDRLNRLAGDARLEGHCRVDPGKQQIF
jgi:hypothetical protein